MSPIVKFLSVRLSYASTSRENLSTSKSLSQKNKLLKKTLLRIRMANNIILSHLKLDRILAGETPNFPRSSVRGDSTIILCTFKSKVK